MAKIDVVMPKMGESVMEGTVLTWYKKPGESVELDETLLEIGTDKVDSEIPSPTAGVIVEILVPEGDTVDVGTRIAVIESDVTAAAASAPAQDAPAPAEAPVEAAAPEVPAEPAPPAEPAAPVAPAPAAMPVAAAGLTDVVMPKMGESVMEGTVLTWFKQPGDAIELDETLLEIGTDKVDSEIPSPAAGILHEILIPEGETVDVGTVIARLRSSEGAVPAVETPAAPPAPAETTAAVDPVPPIAAVAPVVASSGDGAAPSSVPGDVQRHGSDGRFYSPLVRSIAQKEGISQADLDQVPGSGKDGRVTKKDILAYIDASKGGSAVPALAAAATVAATTAVVASTGSGESRGVEVVQMDRMRTIIADHMVRSLSTSAHVTSFAEVDATNLVALRESKKAEFLEREGIKLTYTPFFVRAAVEGLKTHPYLNASVDGKQILLKKDYHVGIAVALENKGLIVPVIRDADGKSVVGLAKAATDVAARARAQQLGPEELQGGTFTVTNIGSLGSLMGTPIISQPQVAILAVGAIKKRPVVIEDPVHGDVIAVRHMMYVSLTYDHRIIDGAMGSSFLQSFVKSVEAINPDEEL